jgi:threonine/homoserine/homoserine lactone efflux protein
VIPDPDSIASVILAGLALSAVPGPSMLYVLSRSIGQSCSAGMASAFGLCLGGMLLAIATSVGLATLFETFDLLAPVLRFAGSAYLIWLGIQMISRARWNADVTVHITSIRHQPLLDIIGQGVLVEALNPKTVLFFALFLPPFVNHRAVPLAPGSMQLQLLILGLLVPLSAVPVDLLTAYIGGSMKKLVIQIRQVHVWSAWISGAMLIVVALNLHLKFL